jgi:hypothetical protein
MGTTGHLPLYYVYAYPKRGNLGHDMPPVPALNPLMGKVVVGSCVRNSHTVCQGDQGRTSLLLRLSTVLAPSHTVRDNGELFLPGRLSLVIPSRRPTPRTFNLSLTISTGTHTQDITLEFPGRLLNVGLVRDTLLSAFCISL